MSHRIWTRFTIPGINLSWGAGFKSNWKVIGYAYNNHKTTALRGLSCLAGHYCNLQGKAEDGFLSAAHIVSSGTKENKLVRKKLPDLFQFDFSIICDQSAWCFTSWFSPLSSGEQPRATAMAYTVLWGFQPHILFVQLSIF